jgi:plastocyanin
MSIMGRTEGLDMEYPRTGNTFMATFEKPDTYNYLCILHPQVACTANVIG